MTGFFSFMLSLLFSWIFFILIVVFLLLALIVRYFKSVNVDCITVMETPASAKQSGRLASASLKVTISNP